MNDKFNRELRIVTASQFDRVFQRSQRFSTRCFRVVYSNNDCGHPRLGMIVAKKNIAKATERNKFKRLTRESFRLVRHELCAVDVVVLANKVATKVSNEELWACLRTLWRKLALPQR